MGLGSEKFCWIRFRKVLWDWVQKSSVGSGVGLGSEKFCGIGFRKVLWDWVQKSSVG